MYFELLRPYFLMLCSFRHAQIIIGFRWFLTAMAIYPSIWVAPSDFQQGENSRIIYVHVPAARMSLLIYIAMAISSVLFLLTKHPLFQLFSKTSAKIGALFTLFTLITGGFWGKPMWGTFWVWDARLTSVLILFFIYLGALRFQEFSADVASIFICIGLINIPIIKFSVNWWNTLHQPSSISQFGTSIHISMPIPILLISTSFFFLTGISSILETRILLGSWWAYHELGWGGWWFWDPVENASLMPWILATACIHSVILPKLNYWTFFLNMVTSLCCVLGTFFVRSGLLASVHSFATDSTRGIFLWCFFLLITSISLIIFLQIKQQSSTRLVGALSSLSSNQGLTALKPVNQILWHLQNTLFVHSRKFTRLPKLMEGKEGHDKVVVYRASKMHKESYLFSQAREVRS
ncbi:unnamed protein product [Sphagnum troendelagicum]|uniref:Cytochrome c assembly protein domain-containing protein n=1 Tax=Sphagnum troendelagicum TaxID=128251 RepID=A0ABP0TG26_9BRYO